MKRTVLVVFSDPHGGHRQGLLNPNTILEEVDQSGNKIRDYHPELTKIQTYLWGMYLSQIKAIGEYAKGDDIVVIANGDLTAGNKHPQLLVSDRLSDQIIIGEYNMLPWYEIGPRAVRLIKGTEAHNFGHGSSEILISQLLRARFPNFSTDVADHCLLSLGGIDIDIAHHGPYTGSRAWLKGNVARYYLQSAMLEEIASGKRPPRLYIRSHFHDEIEETVIIKGNGNRYRSTIVITPSFTFLDDYSRQVARSPSRVTHGMIMIEIVDGDILRSVPLTKTVDLRTREVIQ
jgi:hypothetical protein